MNQNLLIADEMLVITLLLIAIIASMTLRHLKMPYTIGLVITGYVFSSIIAPQISFLHSFDGLTPSSEVILYLFLPPLIFESAIALNTRLLSKNLFPVLGLAIVGVVISAVITGVLVSQIFAMPILFALLFGALISATDPVAVISLFKEIGVPKRLQILVEGESLLNDAAAIVMFQLILTLVSASYLSEKIPVIATSLQFITTIFTSFIGGIVVGLCTGLLLRVMIKGAPRHTHIHQTGTLVAAYLSYLISDHFYGFSGVVAVVVCGCVAARATSDWVGPSRREELNRFWDYIGFLANSLIFLLVGITIASLQDFSILMSGAIIGILFLIGAVTLARLIPVVGIFGLYNLFTPRKVPLSYQMVSFWGGLRGAVAIALSLSLNPSLPYRDAIVAFTVTIVLFTTLVQGLTIGPLIHYFGLGQTRLVKQFHQLYTDLVAYRSGASSLQNSTIKEILDPETNRRYVRQYQAASADQIRKIRSFWDDVRKTPERKNILRLFWLEAIRFEQKEYRTLYDEGLILPAVYAELQYQTAIREDLIQSGVFHPQDQELGPGTRFRKWIQQIVIIIAPKSRVSHYIRRRGQVNRIFAAVAIVVAASGTSRYIRDLAAIQNLSTKEITDILTVYQHLESESRGFLQSDPVRQSEILKDISIYLAERTVGAGMISMLHHHLEEGAGDEKTLTRMMDRLIEEKNAARRQLVHICRDSHPE